MNQDQIIGIISVILAILTGAITVLSAYVGYVTYTLRGRIAKELTSEIEIKLGALEKKVGSHLLVIDLAVEIVAKAVNSSIGTDDDRERIYALEHVLRLSSDDSTEVKRSLEALEQLGKHAFYLLPYIERIKANASWSAENTSQYNALLRLSREAHMSNVGHDGRRAS